MNTNLDNILKEVSYNVSGPVIFNYVNWILEECKKREIKRIYFLARDGYVLQKIAKKICKKNNIKIECRYLYCSRHSLRLPLYNFIGEEKYKYLLSKTFFMTLKSILKRLDLQDAKVNEIASQIGVTDVNKELNNKEFEQIKQKLIKNQLFNSEITKQTKIAHNKTISYLKQEKIFENNNFVIVDSGWTGSTQHCFRQLFNSQKFYPEITGFYFGLYNKQKKEDGEFLTYYFNYNSNIKYKANFNNSLFECFLLAPHGMTLSYKKQNEKFVPILKKEITLNKEFIQNQNYYILNFATEKLKNGYVFNYKKEIQNNYKALKRFITKPTFQEVELFKTLYFCDDISEFYTLPIAGAKNSKDLKTCMFFNRIFSKILKTKKVNNPKVFWPYSAILDVKPKIKKWWYYVNFKAWDYFKFLIPKI